MTHGHNRTHALQHSGTLCGAFNTEIEFAVERPNRLVRQRLSAVLPSPAFRLRIAVGVLSQPLERIAAVRIDCAQPPCGQNISVADKQAASKFVSKRQATAVSSFGAAAEGVYRGRMPSIDHGQVEKLKADGLGATEIAKRLKIGRASVYRVLGSPC